MTARQGQQYTHKKILEIEMWQLNIHIKDKSLELTPQFQTKS